MKLDVCDLGLEKEPETIVTEDGVKVLLQGLGEAVNREGFKKTHLCVAKALREAKKAFPLPSSGYKQNTKDFVQGALFSEVSLHDRVGHARGGGGHVIVRDLNMFRCSYLYCESCLLHFRLSVTSATYCTCRFQKLSNRTGLPRVSATKVIGRTELELECEVCTLELEL
ncbi:hypothetical protein PTKIN_Ptkin12aG0109800 [Pterospermum kingtungense]